MSPQGDSEIVNEARVAGLMSSFAASFRAAVPQTFAEYGEQKAQEFLDEMKFKIGSGLFKFPALSRGYYLGKLKAKLDPRILIATGEYLDGMVQERVEDSSVVAFRVGMRNGIHQSSGLPIKKLQKISEYGTHDIPARPHWHPLIVEYQAKAYEMGRELRTRIAQKVHNDMQQ